MVSVVLKLLREVKECFSLRIDVELAVYDPALVRAVLNCVPDIAIA